MATISTTITHSITLASTYASPLTITDTGAVEITGLGNAIFGPNTQAWTVNNQGLVSTTNGDGIYLQDGGAVINSGTILSPSGVDISGAAGAGGFLTNSLSGYIGGGVAFIAGGTVVNAGRIVDPSARGVFIVGGYGLVTNTGTITGLSSGVYLVVGGTVTDSGTISGGNGTAVAFGGAGANRLVLDPGYQFGGVAVGSTAAGATNTLELGSATGAGTVSATLATEFVHFATVTVDAGAQWTLTGASSLAGIVLTDLGSLTNTGSLTATVTVAGGGYLDNTGTIGVAITGGIAVFGAAGFETIVNSGTLLSNPGLFTITAGTGSAMSVTNSQSGYIGPGGISLAAGPVVNAGQIVDTSGDGILFGGAGTVTNTGTITGSANGVEFTAGGTAIDSGTISGAAGTAVVFDAVASANRLVLGPGYHLGGVVVGSTAAGATNTLELGSAASGGTVSAGLATEFINFGAVTVDAGGQWTLTGNSVLTGVSLTDLGSLTNTGSLAATITVAGSGYLNNTGTITGSTTGVNLVDGGTVVDSGMISGAGGIAMNFGGAVANRLVLDPGYHLGGLVIGSATAGATNTLELGSAASGGTVSAGLATEFINFGAVTVDAGAQWALTGNGTIGAGVTLSNLGTLSVFGTLTDLGTLTNSGSIGGSGNLIVDPATLVNLGTIGLAVTLSGGGSLDNAAGGKITAVVNAVYGTLGAATIVNVGTIVSTATGVVLQAGGTVIDSGSIGGADGTAISFGGVGSNLLVLEHGYRFVGSVFGSGTVGATNTMELAGSLGAAVTAGYTANQLANFQDVLFGAGGNDTLKVSNTGGTLPATISGFTLTSDVIDLTAIGTNGTVTNNDTVNHLLTISGSGGTLTLQLDASDGMVFTASSDGATGTDITPVCFCRGTLILTDRGEVPVEDLAVGDRVKTLGGAFKPIVWIGFGRDLVTRANRLARPIIVRAGALADNVPRHDLYLTHGHALYLDGVLIPVENLVNHRSIRWDDEARVIEYYHIELDDHDVLLAEGAPAESYYDAGNRVFFHNTRVESEAGAAQPPCAPVLTSGETVERIWARLFERAGGRSNTDTTDDPDLHLVIGGERIDPVSRADGVYTFDLASPPAGPVLVSSRSAVPSLVGLNRHEHRRLGVAVQQIILRRPGVMTCIDHDAPVLAEGGCHPPEGGHSWTNGELSLSDALFAHLRGGFTLLVHTGEQTMRYPIAAADAEAA